MNSKGTVCNDMRMLTKWSVASKSFGEQTTAVGHQACSMPGGHQQWLETYYVPDTEFYVLPCESSCACYHCLDCGPTEDRSPRRQAAYGSIKNSPSAV